MSFRVNPKSHASLPSVTPRVVNRSAALFGTSGTLSAGQVPAPTLIASVDQLYFSTVSTRAKIERFMDQKVPATLTFDFIASPVGQDTPRTSRVALEATHRRVSDNLEKPSKKRSDVALNRIDYEPITDGSVLLEALKLDLSALPKAEDGPNAAISPEGKLILKDQFATLGITEKKRPLVENLLTFVRQTLTHGPVSRYLHVDEDGTVTLFQRWRFNPARYWSDTQGARYRTYRLGRLTNGVIGDIRKETPLQTLIGTESGLTQDKSLRKLVKDTLLAYIDRVEADGYTLNLEPVPPIAIRSENMAATQTLPTGTLPNPFAGVALTASEKSPEEKEKPVTELQGGT